MKTLTMNWKKMMITGVLAIGVVALLGGCGSQGGDPNDALHHHATSFQSHHSTVGQ